MKDHYDFSQGKRGAVVPLPPNYSLVNIPLDNEILEWFRTQVHEKGGGDYLELINEALRDHIRRESDRETEKVVAAEYNNVDWVEEHRGELIGKRYLEASQVVKEAGFKVAIFHKDKFRRTEFRPDRVVIIWDEGKVVSVKAE